MVLVGCTSTLIVLGDLTPLNDSEKFINNLGENKETAHQVRDLVIDYYSGIEKDSVYNDFEERYNSIKSKHNKIVNNISSGITTKKELKYESYKNEIESVSEMTKELLEIYQKLEHGFSSQLIDDEIKSALLSVAKLLGKKAALKIYSKTFTNELSIKNFNTN